MEAEVSEGDRMAGRGWLSVGPIRLAEILEATVPEIDPLPIMDAIADAGLVVLSADELHDLQVKSNAYDRLYKIVHPTDPPE